MQFKVWILFDQTLPDCLRRELRALWLFCIEVVKPHLQAVGSPVAPHFRRMYAEQKTD
jgi:hypothetical protein